MIKRKTQINLPISKTFFALGTINNIKCFDCFNDSIINSAVERVLEINETMSAFNPNSYVSRLNKNSGMGFTKINIDTYRLLEYSIEFAKYSYGSFDITIRPLVELWGIGKKGNFVPSNEQIESILSLVDYNGLLLDSTNCSAALSKPGQAIDLGSIAKGFAADEVKKILQENKIKNAMINLGGNVVAMGRRPDGQPWKVGIQNPLAPTGQYLGVLTAEDKTIVTSGSNERFFIKDSIRYHHILDPRTGRPAQSSLLSVTVICTCSTDADALTTALFILGPEKGIPLLKKFNAEAIFITNDLQIMLTDGLKENFKLMNNSEQPKGVI